MLVCCRVGEIQKETHANRGRTKIRTNHCATIIILCLITFLYLILFTLTITKSFISIFCDRLHPGVQRPDDLSSVSWFLCNCLCSSGNEVHQNWRKWSTQSTNCRLFWTSVFYWWCVFFLLCLLCVCCALLR